MKDAMLFVNFFCGCNYPRKKCEKKSIFRYSILNINLTSHHFRLYILNSHLHKMGLFDNLKNKHEWVVMHCLLINVLNFNIFRSAHQDVYGGKKHESHFSHELVGGAGMFCPNLM